MGDITGDGTAVKGLGGAAGYGETLLPRGDDSVARVDVAAVFENGFTLAGVNYNADQLFISTDGLISFGTGFSGVAADPSAIPAPFFAIFNADVDTRLDGEAPESGGVWLDVDAASDSVTITWDNVGFYRRNASQTDTFQMQLFDRGGGNFDVVFRYQDISWTAGDLQGGWGGTGGTPASIAWRLAASGAVTSLAASGNEGAELNLPQTLGNTGVKGLWVIGSGGSAPIDGTASADTLQGTPGDDTINGLGGSDLIRGSAGADLIDGGTGRDTMDFSAAPAGLKIDLVTPAQNSGWAQGDRFVGIEIFRGGGFGDTLLGGGGANGLQGGGGNDLLWGRDGNDSLLGQTGLDRLDGGAGFDRLDGGLGNDTVWGRLGNDTLLGAAGNDALWGGFGHDSVLGGPGADRIWGSLGNDTLTGGAATGDLGDLIYGGVGLDRLTGGAGDDSLYGDVGGDALLGGAGRDRLDGGAGADSLTGGTGGDQFVNSGAIGQGQDWIADFSNAAGDSLVFGIAGASRADFRVTRVDLAGAGDAGVAEVRVTYIPTGMLVWTIVDGADEAAILLQSSMNSFDLL